jgi:hypothetical protein
MKGKPIKSTKSKTATNPETIISIKQDIIDLKIQANELQNKILEKQRKLLDFKESDFLAESGFKDFPDD